MNKTLMIVGGLLGAGTGAFAGSRFDKKNRSDFAMETGAILGGLAGAFLIPALAAAQPTANPVATNVTVIPPPGA